MPDFLNQLIEMAGATESSRPPLELVARMIAALVAGITLAFVYRRTYTGVVYLNAVAHTQVLLAVGGALIWLVVGDNIVRAFGLAGMIGLIRYRTRIADPKDTTILLFSMIIGMACGLGQYVVAAIGTAFVAAALLWLRITHKPQNFPIRDGRIEDLFGLDDDPGGEDVCETEHRRDAGGRGNHTSG